MAWVAGCIPRWYIHKWLPISVLTGLDVPGLTYSNFVDATTAVTTRPNCHQTVLFQLILVIFMPDTQSSFQQRFGMSQTTKYVIKMFFVHKYIRNMLDFTTTEKE